MNWKSILKTDDFGNPILGNVQPPWMAIVVGQTPRNPLLVWKKAVRCRFCHVVGIPWLLCSIHFLGLRGCLELSSFTDPLRVEDGWSMLKFSWAHLTSFEGCNLSQWKLLLIEPMCKRGLRWSASVTQVDTDLPSCSYLWNKRMGEIQDATTPQKNN